MVSQSAPAPLPARLAKGFEVPELAPQSWARATPRSPGELPFGRVKLGAGVWPAAVGSAGGRAGAATVSLLQQQSREAWTSVPLAQTQ